MNYKTIAMVTGLVLLAFGLGVAVGSRVGQKPVVYESVPGPSPPATPADPRTAEAPATGNPPPCVDIRDAEPLVGKRGCVSALVQRVYTARSGNTFLDFCQDYRTCPFTSVIFAADKNKFGDLETLQGKRVEVRGNVVDYRGHAEIVIHDPQQVRGEH
jgi:hypothetical protein